MRLLHSKRLICLLAGTILTMLSHASVAQVVPQIDPEIPFYSARDSLAGGISIAVSESLKPLVQAWVDDLIRQYPELRITVISEGSHAGLAPLLTHRTGMMAMSRRMTTTELGNCLLEFGYKPIAVPVAHHISAVFVQNGDPSAELWSSTQVQAPQSISGLRQGGRKRHGAGPGLIGYEPSLEEPWWINSRKSDGYVKPVTRRTVAYSHSLRQSVYLYVAKFPGSRLPEASAELIRYALSQQGQQWAFDLGYVPLSLEEVRRVTSKWPASP